MLAAPWCGLALGHIWSSLHAPVNPASVRTKQKWKGGVWGWLNIWIFSSGFPSMKMTVASSMKQLFQRRNGFSLFLVPGCSRGLPGPWGLWGDSVGRCSVCVLYMLLPWWMTWFGLVCFAPLWLILCVLFPLCCAIRTLQWDTDPSVLQLQSDSELGYMSALLLLLLSFLWHGCVERPEPLLLLPFPPLLNFQFDKFISFC